MPSSIRPALAGRWRSGASFTVVGLLEIKEGSQIASANIYLSLTDAQIACGRGRGVNVVYLRLKNPSLLTQVKTQIGKELPGVSVTSSDSFLELMGGVSKISDQFSLLASLIALGGAIFLIIKTMLGNLVARSSEIGILKAVGWTEKDVQKQLMGEALLQSLLEVSWGLWPAMPSLISWAFSPSPFRPPGRSISCPPLPRMRRQQPRSSGFR